MVVIYAREAHPYDVNPAKYSYDVAGNPIGQPETYEERVENARKVIDESDLLMPVLVDEIDNSLWCSYGRAPYNAYLIGMDGIIVEAFQQNDPAAMKIAISQYLAGSQK